MGRKCGDESVQITRSVDQVMSRVQEIDDVKLGRDRKLREGSS
jgi:hypothetical protein